LFFWLLLAVVYDGLILLFIYIFAAYPLEKGLIGLILINPIDLGRLILLIHFNISVMLGYTGAVFKQFFGSELGIIVSSAAMLVWIIIPYFYGARIFSRKDF
jgi:Cu-processing system permease protein